MGYRVHSNSESDQELFLDIVRFRLFVIILIFNFRVKVLLQFTNLTYSDVLTLSASWFETSQRKVLSGCEFVETIVTFEVDFVLINGVSSAKDKTLFQGIIFTYLSKSFI